MKIYTFFITTIMSTGLLFSHIPNVTAANNITNDTTKTATTPISNAAVTDSRIAALSFVEHVNYARVALAMKNTNLAKQHLTQARNMAMLIKGAAADQQNVTRIESGRIVYQYDTDYKYHYFPIKTGAVQVKQMDNGPIWAKNDLAVTDADIVYLTLDLSNDKAEPYLTAADAAIASGNLKEADNQLAKLTEAVVEVDSKVAVPSDKAHDNISLAREFIAVKNYDGARYALKHADDALKRPLHNALNSRISLL